MSAPISTPIRILCIHGYRQNGSTFREKTGALRKLLKKQVKLVYIDAPHRVPGEGAVQKEGEQETASGEKDPRGWWFSDVQTKSFDAGQECEASLGLEESVEAVRQAVQDLGPFDGILGFSQGAALVAMLCALQEQGKEPQFKFRFAILVAGFRSACAQHGNLYEAPALSLPSLHVFGQTDRVIPEAKSQALLSRFNCPQVLTHPGGHFVPAASAHRQIYLDFLKKLQNERGME